MDWWNHIQGIYQAHTQCSQYEFQIHPYQNKAVGTNRDDKSETTSENSPFFASLHYSITDYITEYITDIYSNNSKYIYIFPLIVNPQV